MEDSTVNQQAQGTTRRAFLKQVFALTGVSAGAALLNACGSASATAPAPTTAGVVSTQATSAAPTSAATAGSTALSATTTAGGASPTPSTGQNMTPTIVAAANAFLATLNDTEKKTGLFDWTDTAQKQRWSNFPPAGFSRAGLMWAT